MPLNRVPLLLRLLRVLLLAAGAASLLAAPPVLSAGLPGPGLWPRLAGAGLLVCVIMLPANRTKQRPVSPAAVRRTFGLVFACLVWTALLYPAGWLPATFIAGFSACRSGGCTLTESLLLCALLCLVLWSGMDMLQYSLPQGLLFSRAAGA